VTDYISAVGSGVDGFDPIPRNNRVVYLHIHDHDWTPIGKSTQPNGSVHPVYACTRCGDYGYDIFQQYGGIDIDTGLEEPDTRR